MPVQSGIVSPVREAFLEYLDAQRQFIKVADSCAKRRWPDRGAVLHHIFHCWYLYIDRQARRFTFLHAQGEFDTGTWISLSNITARVGTDWSDGDESGALSHDSRYRQLRREIAESESIRDSMNRTLLDGPLRTLQEYAEYLAARQSIYETVHTTLPPS